MGWAAVGPCTRLGSCSTTPGSADGGASRGRVGMEKMRPVPTATGPLSIDRRSLALINAIGGLVRLAEVSQARRHGRPATRAPLVSVAPPGTPWIGSPWRPSCCPSS